MEVLHQIAQEVSRDLNIPVELIEKTYKAYWTQIKDFIKEYDLKKDITKEEFDQLKTSFNIPSFGKLFVTYDSYRRKRDKYVKDQESKTDV